MVLFGGLFCGLFGCGLRFGLLFGFFRFPLGFQLGGVGGLGLGDLLGNRRGVLLHLVHLLLVDVGLAGDLGDELLHLGLVSLQVGLLSGEVFLGFLLGGLVFLQVGLGVCHGLAGGSQLVHDLVVIIHHFGDGVHPVQQVGKAAGVKEHRPVGDVSPLLHAPHALAELVVILGLFLLGLGQFLFLQGDHFAVFLDGLLRDGDLLAEDVDLFLQQDLLVQGGVLGAGQFVQLCLNLGLLGAEGGGLVFQVVDLFLGNRCLGLGHHHRHCAERHDQGQHQRAGAAQTAMEMFCCVVHDDSPRIFLAARKRAGLHVRLQYNTPPVVLQERDKILTFL